MKTMENVINFENIEFDGKNVICDMGDKSYITFFPEYGSICVSLYVSIYDPSDVFHHNPVTSINGRDLCCDVIIFEEENPLCETLEFKAMFSTINQKIFENQIKEQIERSFNILMPHCKLRKSYLKLITKYFYSYYYKKIYKKTYYEVIDMIIEDFRKNKNLSKDFIRFLNNEKKENNEAKNLNN